MFGQVESDHILVSDQVKASQIHNKGFHGTPQSGGSLRLEFIEAVYLLEFDKLEIRQRGRSLSLRDLMTLAAKKQSLFEIHYVVYRDLRQRGFIVKPQSPWGFRVFERGTAPNKSPAKFLIIPVSERATFSFKGLKDTLTDASSTRKELLLGMVDEEGDLTYYKVGSISPKGRGKFKLSSRGKPVEGTLLEERVFVFDQSKGERLHKMGFFGKEMGSILQLSLTEAAYLVDNHVLSIVDGKSSRKLGTVGFRKRARALQPDFDLCHNAYRALKSKGLVVKTGFKYGTHFRVYTGDPESSHAEYLFHIVPHDYTASWSEVSRGVRLAHGVRKEFVLLLGSVEKKMKKGKEDLVCLQISRMRP